ncbi:hypothetical protein BDP27DRAFT_1420149 [Rhodocollybia butyracea]|uniref:Uncharacterized protein n=1 Tax=Rhodocollybia butyracea TaxID=206335 RepID=A0A9P5PVX0_9AGAR|nr:hypothetical protein BDP27DRAFT_1420149 [Rhodocollybia butyracea]
MSFATSVILPKDVVNDLLFYSWATPPDEMPDILSLIAGLNTVLICEIPTLKAMLQKKPIPPRNAYEGPEIIFVPRSGLIRQVEPNTCSSLIKTLLEQLEPLSLRLQHWPPQDEVIAKVLVDIEGILLEMVPKLRATVTSRELSTAEICHLQGNNEHPSSPAISACDDEDEEIVDMTAAFERVLDWLQAEERDEMLPVPSPPVYGKASPDYLSDGYSSEYSSEGHTSTGYSRDVSMMDKASSAEDELEGDQLMDSD